MGTKGGGPEGLGGGEDGAAPRAARTRLDRSLLALPFYEPRHAALADRVTRWCDERADLFQSPADDDPDRLGRGLVRALGDGGWYSFLDPGTPSTAGDLRSLCLVREALAYADDLADYAFSIQALAATPLLGHGSAEQQRRYLPGMASGDLVGSFAVSEEEAGSDVAAVALRADRCRTGYVLNGGKAWIAHGGIADVHCVIARTGEGPGALGLTAFLVPADAPGVRVRERITTIAPRSLAHLAFEDCHVAADSVLGRPGRGFVIAMDVLDRFRMTVGAAAVGFARRAADAALDRARSRPMNGGRLFDLQLVKATLADIDVKLTTAALLVARASWEADRGNRRFATYSSMAKLYATETAQEIVDAALQMFGAAGLVRDSVPERLYRQIRSLRVYEGASEIQKMVIAGALPHGRADQRQADASSRAAPT